MQTTAYTTSVSGNPAACTGAAVVCPCELGYACLEIAPCHWKCLSAPTTAPTNSTSPQSSSPVATSSPMATSNPVTTKSVPLSDMTSISVTVESSRSVEIAATSSSDSRQGTLTTSRTITFSRSRTGGQPLATPTPSVQVSVVTVTRWPSTCPGLATAFTTETLTSCPSEMICTAASY